jgi:hypothetical protein
MDGDNTHLSKVLILVLPYDGAHMAWCPLLARHSVATTSRISHFDGSGYSCHLSTVA